MCVVCVFTSSTAVEQRQQWRWAWVSGYCGWDRSYACWFLFAVPLVFWADAALEKSMYRRRSFVEIFVGGNMGRGQGKREEMTLCFNRVCWHFLRVTGRARERVHGELTIAPLE